ncbi:MAG: multiprotein bridging factor aMBF1 [Thermoproteota archaeon]|nr:multiprotein bridging factor aMBF1 [Thermoproteota archaeon]
MYCEICGKEIQKPITIRVNKTYLKVCDSCKIIGEVVENKPIEMRKVIKKMPTPQYKTLKIPQVEVSIREDFATEIRKAREKMGMTQDMLASLVGEKLSTLKKIEAGKLKPTIELAKKLEKVLKITLLEMESFEEKTVSKKSEQDITLGDIVEMKED